MDCISPNVSVLQQANDSADQLSGAKQGVGVGALVKNAKFAATIREVVDEKTGEIQRFRLDHKRGEFVLDLGLDSARSARFMLQNASRKLLPDVRVAGCLRKLSGGSYVALLQNIETSRCHFGGLQTCGSPWTCPVCSAKISERRKLEIRQAVDTHVAAGGGVEMITLTIRHGRLDVLSDMMHRLRQALRTMRGHRDYKNIRRDFGVIGSIRALEVTHGQANGWHPHFHELWLFDRPLTIRQRDSLRRILFRVWSSSSVSAGLPSPNRQRGVHIQPAKSAADYVAKWGTEPRWDVGSELTKANTKRSKSLKGRTPFDLLRDYSEKSDKQAGALFVEFARAFKGFNQVRWSKGLKDAFGIAEISQEEIAAAQDEPARKLGKVRLRQWKLVLSQPYEGRSTLLQVAESGGFPAVKLFLRSLLLSKVRSFHSESIPRPNFEKRLSRNTFALRRLRRETLLKQSRKVAQLQSVEPCVQLLPAQAALFPGLFG